MEAVPKIGFVSLGCPKALVDSERIITQLRADGYLIVSSYREADLVIVNTCGFTEAAIEESLDVIGEAVAANGKVIVTGCLGVKSKIIQDKHAQVLAITGPQQDQQLIKIVHEHLPMHANPYTSLVPPTGIKLTPPHYAYVKIAEGCNHKCSFCIIPSMRGPLVSRSIDEVLTEVSGLVDAGVKEILIISQDTSAYGVDLKYKAGIWRGQPLRTRFQDLVEALAQFPIWVRLHYVYPYPHVDNVIALMTEDRVLPYLDVPMQHASPRVLKRMRRPANSEDMLRRIVRWREICPSLCIRSSFIVGFPGESQQDFEQLLDFLEQAQLDRVGCFKYSPVSGARANALDGAVPDEVKDEREAEFMQLQERISANKLASKIGKTMRVLVDEVIPDKIIARSYADAPEIDGWVYVDKPAIHIQVGEFVEVKITASDDHDLYAYVVEKQTPQQLV